MASYALDLAGQAIGELISLFHWTETTHQALGELALSLHRTASNLAGEETLSIMLASHTQATCPSCYNTNAIL